MRRRLEQLNWPRICIWRMGPLDIRAVRYNIKQSLSPQRKFAGTRRIIQWNGSLRHDFWTPPTDTQLLIDDIQLKNPHWLVKLYESFQIRRQPHLDGEGAPMRRRQRPTKNELKILTLNSQGSNKKYHILAEYIERIAPDFALIQETRQGASRGDFFTANYNSACIPEVPHEESARGIMIMYRRDTYDINKIQVEALVENWIQPIVAKNRSNGKEHLIVNIYLNSDRQVREEHIPLLVRTIAKLRKDHGEMPITIAGDWNMKADAIDTFNNTYHHLGLERHGDWLPTDHSWRRQVAGSITTTSMIDHFLTEPRELPPTVSIDSGYGESDHYPIIATWNTPTPPCSTTTTERMDHKLILAKADAIRETNFFSPLLDLPDTDDPEELAQGIAQAAWDAAKEVGGTKMAKRGQNRRKKMRTSKRSQRLIRARTRALQTWTRTNKEEDYTLMKEISKETKRSLKEDAKTRTLNFQMKLCDAIATGEGSDEAWRTINSAIGRSSTKMTIKALENIKTGELATTKESVGEALFEHYHRLLSDTENFNSVDYDAIPIHQEETELPGINEDVEWPELCERIKKLGRNKSPGPDGVVSEIYICATRTEDPVLREVIKVAPICDLGRALLKLVRLIWKTGKFPRRWDAATIISLPKKPGSLKPGDYRGISLIQTLSKLVTSILATRILKGALVTGRLCKEQAGFRSYEEAVAQATLVYDLANRARENGQTTYITFIDAEKAFDRAPHGAIIAKCRAFGVRGQALELIRNLYQNASFTVRNEDWTSQPGKVEKGVKQGCPLSPILFCIFMNDLNKAIQHDAPSPGHSLYPGGPQITAGKFADDVAMIAPDRHTAIHQQLAASKWMDSWKMKANAAKCAVMIIEPTRFHTPLTHDPKDWKLQGQPIPITQEYTYLGIHLNDQLDLMRSANFRIKKATAVKNMCLKFFWSSRIPLHLKVVILKAIIIPVMTYGCEVWGWSPQASESADMIVTECLRSIITGSRTSNATLLRHTLDILSTKDLTIKKSIRLFIKSKKSLTHFHDITSFNQARHRQSWASRTKRELTSLKDPIQLPAELKSQHNLAAPKANPTSGIIEDWKLMDYIHSQLHRRAIQKDLQHEDDELDSTERFREGGSIAWNNLYLEAWKLHPMISKGFTVLLKMRITDFRGTYRLAREGHGLESWKTSCPFCNSPSHIEYAEHIITSCPHWSPQRKEAFNTPIITEWEDIAKIIATLGQKYTIAMKRISPSFNLNAQDEDTINAIKKLKEALDAIDLETLKEWIPKVAQFLDAIHHKRRKSIESWNNAHQALTNSNPTKKTTDTPKRKQLRITDIWTKAPAAST